MKISKTSTSSNNPHVSSGSLENVIRVGVGVLIFKDGQVLLGRRKGAHGDGEYAFPGGHLEYLESIEECARREVREETGMEVQNIRFIRLSNLKTYAPKHYIDIGLACDWKSGEPQVLEPEKIDGWQWYSPDKLPQPLFATIESYLDALNGGSNFIDS